MRIDVVTLFPGMFEGPLTESILQRAREQKILDVHFHDLRGHGIGNYRQVDDTPYGGGAGMVLRCEPLVETIEEIMKSDEQKKPHRIYLSPRGEALKQEKVEKYAQKQDWLLLVCGRYEGIDQRVIDGWIDEEISIGEYVLTGGELPAMVLIDAIARQLPGVLGDDESSKEESFSSKLERKKEYPHYTKPEEFRGMKVPDVLVSGNHKKIEEWRKKNLK